MIFLNVLIYTSTNWKFVNDFFRIVDEQFIFKSIEKQIKNKNKKNVDLNIQIK